jgi:hypothetical protein
MEKAAGSIPALRTISNARGLKQKCTHGLFFARLSINIMTLTDKDSCHESKDFN